MSGDRLTFRARAPKRGSKYYLPRNTFRAVVAFCLSYKDLKRQIANIYGVRSQKIDGMPHGYFISDPTPEEAIRCLRAREKVEIIEDTVLVCAGEALYPFMLKAVTDEDCTFEKLKIEGLKIGRNTYLDLRRRIYFSISEEM